MYSPFFDDKGNPIEISKIKYEHLMQLVDCEEGHHLEIKQKLDDGGKHHLPKTIAAFANCEGGWLIVGMEDKTRAIYPIDKCDYSQMVGKIVSRVSPMPEFETKFVTLPNDVTKGVLVIYVYEGRKAPYIVEGVIYVRCGSNKEPVKPADRGNVEYLLNRTALYDKDFMAFFKRDYFYPYNNTITQKNTYPIINVYLKNLSVKKDKRLNDYANRNKFISFVMKKYPIFEHYHFSMNSVVFCHKQVVPGSANVTVVVEVFYDWSCKIYIPLITSDLQEIDVINRFYEDLGIEIVDENKLINGGFVLNSLMACLLAYCSVAERYHLKESDYAFCIEIENAQDTIMCFAGEEYKKYVSDYGLPYASKLINRSEIIYLKDFAKVSFATLVTSSVNDFIGPAYGFKSDVILDLLECDNLKYC